MKKTITVKALGSFSHGQQAVTAGEHFEVEPQEAIALARGRLVSLAQPVRRTFGQPVTKRAKAKTAKARKPAATYARKDMVADA